MPKKKSRSDQSADPSTSSGQALWTDSTLRQGSVQASSPQASSGLSSEKRTTADYEIILQASLDGFWINDFSGRILDANEALCLMLGYSRDELLRMSVQDIEVSESPDETAAHIRKVIETGNDRFQTRHRRKDGKIIDIEISVQHVAALGERFFVFARDITERKRVENKRQYHSEIITETPDAIIATKNDEGFTITSWNRGAEEIYGWKEKEVLGKSSMFLQNEYPGQDPQEILEKILQTGLYEGEVIQSRKDGTRVFIDAKLIARKDNNGETIDWICINRDITERKRAEDRLRWSEERFRDLWEKSFDGMRLIDHAGTILMVNQAFCHQVGKRRDELEDHPLDVMYEPIEGKRILAAATEKFRSKTTVPHFERHITLWDGRRVWFELSNSFIELGTGQHFLLSIFRDATGRKQAEEALRVSENRLQNLFETMAEGVVVIAPDGQIVQANLAAERILGIRRSEIESRNYITPDWVILRADGTPMPPEEMAGPRAMQEKQTITDAVMGVRRPDSSVSWINVCAVPLLNSAGELDGVIGTFADITERKRAEEILLENQKKFQALVETTGDFIWEMDSCGSYTYCSPQLEILWGLDPKEMLGKTPFDLVPPEDREQAIKGFSALSESASPFKNMETRSLDATGQVKSLEISGVPFFDMEGKLSGYRGITRDITERKRTEEALQGNEHKLQTLYETMVQGIVYQDADGRIISANPAAERILGLNLEQMQGRTSIDARWHAVHEDGSDFPGDTHPATIALRTGERVNNVIMGVLHPLEEQHSWININAVPQFRPGETKPYQVYTAFDDITERKRAEEALRTSEASLSEAMEIARLGHWEYNVASDLFTFNDHFYAMFRTTADQVGGYTMSSAHYAQHFVHPDDMALVGIETRKALETTDPHYSSELEHRIIYADGEIGHITVRIFIVKDGQGRTIKTYGVNQDITERKRMEKVLLIIGKAVESTSEAIGISDAQGHHFYQNKASSEMFEYATAEEMEAAGGGAAVVKDPKVAKEMFDAIMSGKSWSGELEMVTKSGYVFPALERADAIKDSDGNIVGLIGIVTDITERKRAEDALRHAQKTQSIGTLAGGIAHDFNNLLNAVIGQSALALGKLPKESLAGSNVIKAMKAAERAADLTRQLLAYSGKGKFHIEEIDLNLLVNENVEMLEVSIPKTTQLRFELGSPSPHIRGDVVQIQQVIMNLIINAGEAMGADPGYIYVRTSGIKLSEDDTEYWKHTTTPLAPGLYALLQVIDTGHGMKPEVVDRIFDPFFTTKFTGRGLGLAAVLGILRGHGGGIRLASEEGKGTRFDVVFPLVATSVVTNVPEEKAVPMVIGEGKTVLVIDDEPSVLELLTDIFEEAKFTVIGASDPIEGIELYRKHQGSITMVILDYSMPGMDGKSAFEELIKINKDVKVLLCSGYTEELVESAFGVVRPAGFIHKPYQPAVLLERMSQVFSEGKQKA